MDSFDSDARPARRRILGSIVSGATLLGLGAASSTANAKARPSPAPPPAPLGTAAEEQVLAQARLRSYKTRRSSTWDRTGGNTDYLALGGGQTATMFDVTGAGVITHLWFTVASRDPMHLKNYVLRAWWDGEETPSIEVPLGDFFGLGLGQYFTYESELVCVAPAFGLNAYFQMPFATAARMTVTNESPIPTDRFYYHVDYVTLPRLPADVGRFHAQYRQATPCQSVGTPENLLGVGNYVFLEALGRGHFVGVTHSVLVNHDGWFGEGDDMIFIDGDTVPTINGTGTEDYYNGAWDFGRGPFAYMRVGAPLVLNPESRGGRWCLYRWHTESPITFEKAIRVTMEHGHGNFGSDNFYTTAFWYQTEPHAPFPVLPPASAREPRLVP